MNDIDPIPAPDEIELVTSTDDAREIEEEQIATAAERDMTSALAALKRRGQRVVEAVEHTITPRRVAIGVGVGIGVGLLLFALARRRRAPSSIGGTIARSLLREAAGRLVLGAAATAGARLAEAAVPLLVATISAQHARRARPSRPRKSRTSSPPST